MNIFKALDTYDQITAEKVAPVNAPGTFSLLSATLTINFSKEVFTNLVPE